MHYTKLVLVLSAIFLLLQAFECRPYLDHQRSKRQSLEIHTSQNYRNNVLPTLDESKARLRRSNSKKKSVKKEWQWAYMLPSSMVKPRMDVAPES